MAIGKYPASLLLVLEEGCIERRIVSAVPQIQFQLKDQVIK
jgi:hypothetical protein